MKAGGLLYHYFIKYMGDALQSPTGPQKDGNPVTLNDIYLVLLGVLFSGICLSALSLAMELIVKHSNVRNCQTGVWIVYVYSIGGYVFY